MYGPDDPDPHPDPYQNVMNPDHWFPDPLPHAGVFASFFYIYLYKSNSSSFSLFFSLWCGCPCSPDTDLIRNSLSQFNVVEEKKIPQIFGIDIMKKENLLRKTVGRWIPIQHME
jgi:hypothetical protein